METVQKCLRISFCREKRSHRLILFLGLLPILFLCLLPLRSSTGNIAYPIEDVAAQSPYVQQTDAFLKGQIPLDVAPSAELVTLENPYDRDAREGIDYLWDRAYYNGNYYSYFGVAPIFGVYLPYYALFGALPDLITVCVILSCFAALMASLAYRELVLHFLPDGNLCLLILALPVFLMTCGVMIGNAWQDTYYVAVLSAMGALMGFYFSLLRALREHRFWLRTLLFAVSALCLVATVASRPTAAVMALTALPLLLSEIRKQKQNKTLKDYFRSMLYFFLPLLFGAALIMWYNHARFDSVWEFGARYQLTVNDVSHNRLTLSHLFPALLSYFTQAPGISPYFPFFSRSVHSFGDPSLYVYRAATVGALWFGTPIATLFSPLFSSVRRHRTLCHTLVCATVLSLSLSFVNYCLGGVNLRYLLDFLPTLALCGTVALLCLWQDRTLPRLLRTLLPAALVCVGLLTCLGVLMRP